MIIKKIFISLLLLMLFGQSLAQAQVVTVGVEKVKAAIQGKKFVIVDARTAAEYADGHIPGAINIMPDKMQAGKGLLPKDKQAPIIFYCRGVG